MSAPIETYKDRVATRKLLEHKSEFSFHRFEKFFTWFEGNTTLSTEEACTIANLAREEENKYLRTHREEPIDKLLCEVQTFQEWELLPAEAKNFQMLRIIDLALSFYYGLE